MNICKNCLKETKNPSFCCRSCSATYNNKQSPKRIAKQWKCITCGCDILSHRKYCKEHSPNSVDWSDVTLGDTKARRSYQHFSRIRSLARILYLKYNDDKCHFCDYNKHIEIHHIKSISDYDDSVSISEINDLSNIVGVCPNCHWEIHQGLITL